ncbi:DUF378 domain-containing protein [Beijerinckia indica]|uniref:DUF378 domain-containing protein n=1 Tax=Beijerinckia indica subsp. indica (strain ATCC 9039 / DSM 1715 / NCIMB 8712) TaxID=395963 RepID=B2IJ82_BEII9|nr:DUF378 domain-containing protein [Beijerinckia indica]ACB94845.1 protein of unknown function DUF378 [Beijerinckia indica subsp. indica ATCC 9039]
MKSLNIATLILVILGGLNWGLFALANIDIVATLFGGTDTVLAKLTYIVIGLSAVYQLLPFSQAISVGEITAENMNY